MEAIHIVVGQPLLYLCQDQPLDLQSDIFNHFAIIIFLFATFSFVN